MLETLDSFDWHAVGTHVYGKNEQIPQQIRALLTGNDLAREDVLGFLFGSQQDFGSIYATTAPIIRFTLEILADESIPGAEWLLECYAAALQNKVYTGGGRSYSIQQVRNYLAAYDAVEAGLSLYVARLNASQPDVRSMAAQVLGELSASAAVVLPALTSRYRAETEQEVKVALIRAVKRCLSELDYSGTALHKEYAPFFAAIVESHSPLDVRYAAAVASIEVSRSLGFDTQVKSRTLPPHTTDVLIKAFQARDQQRTIVSLLSILSDQMPLVTLLKTPNLSPELAHLIVRGLLMCAFPSFPSERYWYEPYDRERQGHFYRVSASSPNYKGKLSPSMRSALAYVIKSEAFWSQPTNLFSHFFGLPNDREALRALLSD